VSQVDVKLEDISSVKKKISFEIPWDEVKAELDSVYREVGKKAKIKGFRPGKVPRKVLENYFREEAESETINNLINKYYWQTLDEKEITALSRPEINQEDLKENSSFIFSASFETEPEFEPQGYQEMDLHREKIIVTENDIKKKIDELRNMFATMEEISDERPVKKGDFVMIDFQGTFQGEQPDGMKAENFFLEIGSQKFIPGFEEQITGMKKDETRQIKVTFPEDYHEKKYASQEVIFDVALKNIKEKKLPNFDESFIKNFEKYDSLEDLKNEINKALEEEAARNSEANLQNNITESLLEKNEFEAPPSLVERQIFYMMADMQRRMVAGGMDEKSASELCFNMHDQFKEEAEKQVKSFLILKKIAEKQSITVGDTEADEHIRELTAKYGKDYELIKKAYENEDRIENLKTELRQKKVFDFIVQSANIKETEKQGLAAAEVKK